VAIGSTVATGPGTDLQGSPLAPASTKMARSKTALVAEVRIFQEIVLATHRFAGIF